MRLRDIKKDMKIEKNLEIIELNLFKGILTMYEKLTYL